MGRSAPNSCNGSRSTVGVLRTGGPPDFRRASVRPQLRRTSLSAASKARKPAYPLGPRFAGPRQGLAGGCAPSGPPERQRHVMSAGRAVWVKIRASEAERAEWHAKARSAGLTLSDLVRRSVGRVRTWTVPHAEVERERTRELARIGNNLNQIAPLGQYPQGGGRGRRGDRPPHRHRAGARGAGPRRVPGSRCSLSSWLAGPARPVRRPTTFSVRGTRPGSRAKASRSSGEIPTRWPPWRTRWRSSTSTHRA